MTFLQGFTLLSALFFLMRNKIDFLLLFFCSLILYSWQIIYGIIWVPPYTFEVSSQSQWIVSIVIGALIFFTIANDLLSKNINELTYDKNKESDEETLFIIFTIISYFFSFYALYNGWENFLTNKADFLRSTGFNYYFITYFPASMSFLFFVVSQRYKLAVFALIPLLFYLVVGFRASIVTTIIFAIFIYMYNNRIFTLQTLKPIFLVGFMFMFFALYKFSYIFLQSDNFNSLADLLEFYDVITEADPRFESAIEYFLFYMFSAEFGQVSSNLSLTASMNLSNYYSFPNALIGSIPFFDTISGINEEESRFSTVIETYANPGFSYGLGSSIWGEMYQAGGYIGVFLFSFITIFLIFTYNLSFYRSKERFTLFSYFIAFLSFYIHRNDFVLVVGNIKNIIFVALLGFIILWLVKNKISLNLFHK